MRRQLVTVRTISSVSPIEGADRIEIVAIDGWNCIVPVGEFKAGDQAVFFEIDSFLPADDPRWEFLQDKFITWEKERGFRVRAMKMRGKISQGLVQPLGRFPEIISTLSKLDAKHGREGAASLLIDMSFEEALGVRKYEVPEIPISAMSKVPSVPFPTFVKKTDQIRCQNLPRLLEDWQDKVFQETTKMDGSSMTAYFLQRGSPQDHQSSALDLEREHLPVLPGEHFGVCSKNIELPESSGGFYWDVAKKNRLSEKLSRMNRSIAIQGELCGSAVQNNHEQFPDGFHDFWVYSIWDIDKQEYLKPKDTEEMATEMGLKHVHVGGYYRLGGIADNVSDLL
ncbi:RNA ligase, DRB0094 family [Xylariaceae sp. FL0016]|nr:RNA ligase, DRB0094 family [Xylariaceae sp. FL0016]